MQISLYLALALLSILLSAIGLACHGAVLLLSDLHLVELGFRHCVAGLCQLCCCGRAVAGGVLGRPVGAKNNTEGEVTRSSDIKRKRRDYLAFADGTSSAQRMDQNRKSKRKQRSSSGNTAAGKHKRTLSQTASSKQRRKHTKDKRRQVAMQAKREQKQKVAQIIKRELVGQVLSTLTYGQVKQLALVGFYHALASGFGTREAAAAFVGQMFDKAAATVLVWARGLEMALLIDGLSSDTDSQVVAEKLASCDAFWQSLRGKHAKTAWLLADADRQEQARAWIRAHAQRQGRPNMKVAHFRHWLNTELLKGQLEDDEGVCESTARAYVHRLGFQVTKTSKGIVIKEHEREDVVKAREKYIKEVEKEKAQGSILIFQDESCFCVYDCESWCWSEIGQTPPQTKGKDKRGQAIMVSLFVCKEKGILHDITFSLEVGKDPWFNSAQFLKQVRSRFRYDFGF